MALIREFHNHFGDEISGRFRLLSTHTDWHEQRARPCIRLRIADFTGEASVVAPQSLAFTVDSLSAHAIVDCDLTPCALTGQLGGTIRSLKACSADSVRNIAQLFPAPLCPNVARPSLEDLYELLKRIQRPSLSTFLSSAFDRHHSAFMQAQAGWKYHHNFPGGLLVHSVSVAQEAERQASLVYPCERDRVELITVAALLHDMGKAVKIKKGRLNPARESVPHEFLTLTLLDAALVALGEDWPEGARCLTQMLVWLAQPGSVRAKRCDAEIVHAADVLDVKANRAAHSHSKVNDTSTSQELIW